MLHGRRRETDAVDALLEGVRASTGSCLLLRGEPGIGKTELLTYALERAPDMKCLSVVGVPSESGLPFAGLDRLLRPVKARFDDIPEIQAEALRGALGAAASRSPDRFLVGLALLNVLSAASEQRPVLCLIDDVQWLDRESMDALLFVRRRLDTEAVAFLMSETVGTGPVAVAPEPPWLEVLGLDRVASDALLVEQANGEVAPQVRAALWDASKGNPLALKEMLSGLSPSERTGATAIPNAFRIASSLQDTLLLRAQRLPEETQQMLLVAAAEGSGDLVAVLKAARVLGIPESALEPAEREGVVRSDGSTYSFHHPLMRTAVYQGAPFGRRQSAHRALAEVCQAQADRSAWHLAAAAVGPDKEVADALLRTARRAREREGYATASRALEQCANHTEERAIAGRLLTESAECAWLAGHQHRTMALIERATQLASDPSDTAHIEYVKGEAECAWGDRRLGLTLMVLGATRMAEIDHLRASRMLVEAARVAWQDADLESVADIGDRLTLLELPAESPEERSARVMRGIGLVAKLDHDAGFPLLDVEGNPDADPQELHMAAWGALVRGDDPAARHLLLRASETARSRGMMSRVPQILTNIASLDAFSGDFQSASVRAAEGIGLARDTGQDHVEAQLQAVLVWIAAARGVEIHPHFDRARELARLHHVQLPLAITEWALGLQQMGAGSWPLAFTHLESVSTPGSDTFHPMIAFLSAADFVEAALRVDNRAALTENMVRFEAFSQRSASPWVHALLARTMALLSEGDTSIAFFEQSLASHAQSRRIFDEARTRLLYGEHLRRTTQRSAARRHLRYAAEVFDSLKASPWSARAASELRATGESARPRSTQAHHDLTAQQTEIVRLVQDGFTNKQIAAQLFLSPRTVDYHLRNVFVKLGITSRTELMRIPV